MADETSSEIAVRIEDMNKVVELKLQGWTVPQIVKETSLTRVKVLNHLDEWHKWAQQQQDVMGRAREMLASVDQHYDMIMKELWEVHKGAKDNGDNGISVNALKTLAGIEKDRANLFQQAGLNDQSMLADEIRENERKHEELIKILRDVVYKCPVCKTEVAERIAHVTGKAEAMQSETIIDVNPVES